jgi:hypothetical protein
MVSSKLVLQSQANHFIQRFDIELWCSQVSTELPLSL